MATEEENNLFAVETGSIGLDKKPVRDIFAGEEKLEPGDPRLEGVNLETLQLGTAPEGFKSEFLSPTVITSDDVQEETPVDEAAKDEEDIARLDRQKRKRDLEAELGIGPAPEAPKLKDTLEKLRTEKGLPAIESDLAEINTDIRELEAAAREQLFDAEGKPQQLGALRGEQRRIAQDAQNKLDALNRKKQTIVDELNMKNSTINQLMQFTQQDFANASAVYQQKFNQNMEFYKMIKSEMSEEEQSAMSKWQVLADQYEQSGLTWDTLNPEQQAHLESLAVRGGMPGLSQFLGAGQGEIKTVNQRTDASGNSYYDVLRIKPDGSMEVESIFRGKEKVPGSGGGTGGGTTDANRSSWVNQGLSASLLTTSNKLVKSKFDKIVDAGVPSDVVEDI